MERIGVHVLGGGSALRAGSSTGSALILSTERLDRILAHERDDLTFTAESGLLLSRAQAGLRPHGQRLALSPRSKTASLGGVVARSAEGWTRKTSGMVRDQVLGLEIVTGDGRLISAGGRVVKNVSGFDLCRLMTGARAALGLILSLTFRLRALAEARRVTRHATKDLDSALALARELDLQVPDAEHVRVTRSPQGDASILVSLAGADARVQRAAEIVDQLLPQGHALTADALDEDSRAFLRVELLPADVAPALRALATWPRSLSWNADISAGYLEASAENIEPLSDAELQQLARILQPFGALVEFPMHAHQHLRREAAFGAIPAEHLTLLHRLGRLFDPHGILEPGVHAWK
jgi:FAD/FMN-containing dehydrogenase